MATLSVSVPDDLRRKMSEMEDVNWSAVARRAFDEKIKQVEFLKGIASKSKLTPKDAQELSRKINEGMAGKFRGIK